MKTSTFAALLCTLLPLALAEAPYSPSQDTFIPPPEGQSSGANAEAAAAGVAENVDYRIKNVPHYIYLIEKPVIHRAVPYVKHDTKEALYTVPVFHHGLHSAVSHKDLTVVNGHHHHAVPVVHHEVPLVHGHHLEAHHAVPVVHHDVPLVHGHHLEAHHAVPVVHHDLPVVHHADTVAHHAVPVVKHHTQVIHHDEPVVHHSVHDHHDAHHVVPVVSKW